MLGHRRSYPNLGAVLGTVLLSASFGCQGESPVTVDGALLVQAEARGGGGRPSVDQAIPNWGEQAQTLEVRVLGSGYDSGSVVTFKLNGGVAKVTTASTEFVNDTELRANIIVEADADLELYDIEVMTRGKKGIGADLFQVVEQGAGQPPGQIEPIPLEVFFQQPLVNGVPTAMTSDSNPRSEPGSANRAEILLSGNFQVHWSGFGAVTLDLSEADSLYPDPAKVPQWYPDGDGTCGGACASLDGYISTGFPFAGNTATGFSPLDNGFRDMVPGGEYYTAMHRVWTANNANWVLHFHAPPDPSDVCSHQGLSGEHMTVRVEALDGDADSNVDAWTLRPQDIADSPAILCGFAAKGKPFNAMVGQFQVPFGLDLVRLP